MFRRSLCALIAIFFVVACGKHDQAPITSPLADQQQTPTPTPTPEVTPAPAAGGAAGQAAGEAAKPAPEALQAYAMWNLPDTEGTFSAADLLACDLRSALVGPGVLMVHFRNAKGAQFFLNAAQFDTSKSVHKMTDLSYGQLSLTTNAAERYLSIYFTTVADVDNSTECETKYAIEDGFVKADFSCTHLQGQELIRQGKKSGTVVTGHFGCKLQDKRSH